VVRLKALSELRLARMHGVVKWNPANGALVLGVLALASGVGAPDTVHALQLRGMCCPIRIDKRAYVPAQVGKRTIARLPSILCLEARQEFLYQQDTEVIVIQAFWRRLTSFALYCRLYLIERDAGVHEGEVEAVEQYLKPPSPQAGQGATIV